MTSDQAATSSARNPATDPLLTPKNAALLVIDYQPSQIGTVTSMDRDLLLANIVSVARTAKTFDLPVVLSTVNVANGQGPTLPSCARTETVPDIVDIVLTTRLLAQA